MVKIQLPQNFNCGIHTLQINCRGQVGRSKGVIPLNSGVLTALPDTGELISKCKINPAKGNLPNYSLIEDMDFIQAQEFSIEKITRLDFAFDFNESYLDLYKLNKVLISLVALQSGLYKTKFWESKNPITQIGKNINFKSNYYGIEFYNKTDESQGKSPVVSRLEIRLLKLWKTENQLQSYFDSFIHLWEKKLLDSLNYFDELQEILVTSLLDSYFCNCEGAMSKKQFIRNQKEDILTVRQLQFLMKSMGYNNSKKAYGIISDLDIEIIDFRTIEKYVNILIFWLYKYKIYP